MRALAVRAAAGLRAAPPATLRLRRAWLALPPAWRRRVSSSALAALLVACGYMFWFRDSSFVAVERVTITGLTSEDGGRIEAALTSTARDMTTLHVRREELELTARSFPVVQGLVVEADFPHTLRIRVIEHDPVAVVRRGGRRVPVAADGTLLAGLPVTARLPVLRVERGGAGERLAAGPQADALAVATAAPRELRDRIASVSVRRRRGLVARIRGGPEIRFGDATHLRRKWAAATRVLADPGSRGAAYVDVRSPARPVAGGLPVETIEPSPPPGEPVEPAPDAAAAAPPAGGQAPPAAGQTAQPPAGAGALPADSGANPQP